MPGIVVASLSGGIEASTLELAVAVDDQPRIALHYGDRVERGREPLGHRGDADVQGDVTQSFRFGQPEIAERARDRPPGMVGSQYEIGAPVGAEHPQSMHSSGWMTSMFSPS